MNKFKHTYGVRTVANDVSFVYTGAQSPNFIWKVRTELVSQTPVSWFMIPDDPIRRRPPPATKKKMHIYLHVIFHNVFARTHAMYGKCSQSFTSMLAVKVLWIVWRRIAIGFHRTSLSKEKVLYLFVQVYGWLLLSSCFYRADDTSVHWAFQVLSSTDMMPNNTIFAVLPTLNGSKTTMLIGWVVCVCW